MVPNLLLNCSGGVRKEKTSLWEKIKTCEVTEKKPTIFKKKKVKTKKNNKTNSPEKSSVKFQLSTRLQNITGGSW